MNVNLAFDPPCGPVTGWRDGAVVRATGIPYATAERFQPPAPATDWSEMLEATSLSPACPQAPVPFLDDVLGTRYGELPGSEDCQRLSITLPADLDDGERLPVMVWLHGGSYTSGSGDLAIFDPAVAGCRNPGDRRLGDLPAGPLRIFVHQHRPARQPGPAGPDRGVPLGAAQHRIVRRRSGQGHRVRAIRRGRRRRAPHGDAGRGVALPAGHHSKCAAGYYPGAGKDERRHGRRRGSGHRQHSGDGRRRPRRGCCAGGEEVRADGCHAVRDPVRAFTPARGIRA